MSINNDVILLREWQKSPLKFIKDIWGLVPERDNAKFIKGKNLTWQQEDFFLAVEKALSGEAPRRISIASGHGVGKSSSLSLLTLWFLFCHYQAQVGATAPTTEQMYDVLWKEIKKWIDLMPKEISAKFEWTATHIRIVENPETWFARARTARKETPEALAGIHGDHVLILADEASGVPDEIYRTAEGALTDKNILAILTGNPTRILGYFYDTHHSDKPNWQTLQFSSEDSPLVDWTYVKRIKDKYGEDSDEYKIRVLGQFPREDAIDEKGFVPLLMADDLKYTTETRFSGKRYMGVDPSGEGSNETIWVVRDNYRARIVAREKISNPKTIAQKTLTLMDSFGINDNEVVIDNFGEGANVSKEIALANIEDRRNVNAVNAGNKSEKEEFLNLRADLYFRLKEWLRSGGELIMDEDWRQLLTIKYRRELNGSLRIMSKLDMQKVGIPSPDVADALMLTFYAEQTASVPKEVISFKPDWNKRSETKIISSFRPRWG